MSDATGEILSCTGPLTQETEEEVCDALAVYLEAHPGPTGIATKLFSVFVEISQNIRKYTGTKRISDERTERIRHSAEIMIRKDSAGYQVSSVNLVEEKDALALASHLDSIRRLSPEATKKVFRDTLRDRTTHRPNTGLGFLDIAKKTQGRYTYRFEPAGEGLSSFHFSAELRVNEGVLHE